VSKRVTLSTLFLGIAALAVAPTLLADDGAWPNRPVRVIATSPPGGSIDLLARILAQELTKKHGQPFVVENRPGANGDLGVAAVLRAPADGHWFFVAPAGPFSINLNLRSSMPFNPGTDIAPVTLLAVTPLVLMVHPSVPATNLQELLAWLRAQSGKATYASQAVGSTGHLAMELFKSLTGVEAIHVPYKGSAAQAATDLVAGRVSMSFVNTSTTIAYLQKGMLRAIAVAEKRRITAVPDIPTLDESGLPGFEASAWIGLGTRAGTPDPVVLQLAHDATQALAQPESAHRLAALGIEPRPMPPPEFAAFIRRDTERWAEVIRRSGAKAE
jgi:tripartite-type tricarboxylate transporter receptor subunit TctC